MKLKCWPTDKPYRLTSPFGWRNLFGQWVLHDGIDLGTWEGTPIYACHDGIVTNHPYDAGYGWWVSVRNSEGHTEYGHLSAHGIVPTGDRVRAGQLIAYSGNTGQSTGPHLHLRYRPAGAGPTDPAPALYGLPYALDLHDRYDYRQLAELLLRHRRDNNMAEIWDIFDAETGDTLFHAQYAGGVLSPTIGPHADEEAGYHRVRMSLENYRAREQRELEQVGALITAIQSRGA